DWLDPRVGLRRDGQPGRSSTRSRLDQCGEPAFPQASRPRPTAAQAGRLVGAEELNALSCCPGESLLAHVLPPSELAVALECRLDGVARTIDVLAREIHG